jgi:hypothetical protein
VFTDDCKFNMGELTMTCDPQNHEPTYHITSHLIQNRRFCPLNSKREYRTVSSKSIDKAVSKARTYLRPNKLSDIVRCTFERARSARGEYANKLERAFDTATRELGFATFRDDGKGQTPFHNNFACANVQTYGNDVPEDVESKISVLSMLDSGEFVEEVGFKYDDNVYYLMNKEQ